MQEFLQCHLEKINFLRFFIEPWAAKKMNSEHRTKMLELCVRNNY